MQVATPRGRKITEVFLNPGEYFVGNARHRIGTLLGSCVSITIWHARTSLGAMSHFLLPMRSTRLIGELDGRYGDEALCLMLRELALAGAKLGECEAKIFGGGDMFPDHSRRNEISVGQKNGQAARRMLNAHGINVLSESLFGEGYRRVIFDLSSGRAWVRQARIVDATNLRYGIAS